MSREIVHDALDGPFRDSDPGGQLSHSNIGVLCDQHQHPGVVSEKGEAMKMLIDGRLTATYH